MFPQSQQSADQLSIPFTPPEWARGVFLATDVTARDTGAFTTRLDAFVGDGATGGWFTWANGLFNHNAVAVTTAFFGAGPAPTAVDGELDVAVPAVFRIHTVHSGTTIDFNMTAAWTR